MNPNQGKFSSVMSFHIRCNCGNMQYVRYSKIHKCDVSTLSSANKCTFSCFKKSIKKRVKWNEDTLDFTFPKVFVTILIHVTF